MIVTSNGFLVLFH